MPNFHGFPAILREISLPGTGKLVIFENCCSLMPANGNYLNVAVLDAHHCGGKKAHPRLVAFVGGVAFLVR
jgi:hypothetical protein